MSHTKREHYIPQFYLKNFSPDNKRIWQYQINSNTAAKLVPIESICHEKNLYEFKNEDGSIIEKNLIESRLSALEGCFSNVIKSIMSKASHIENFRTQCFLTEEEKFFLILFVATLILRSPTALNIGSEVAKELLGEQISDIKATNLSLNTFLPIYKHVNPEEHTFFNSVINSFENMAFQILSVKSDCFLTCDYPVALYGENGFHDIEEIFFPLTPRLLLFMAPQKKLEKGFRNRLVDLSPCFVDSINDAIIFHCNNWVFSANKFTNDQIKHIQKVKEN